MKNFPRDDFIVNRNEPRVDVQKRVAKRPKKTTELFPSRQQGVAPTQPSVLGPLRPGNVALLKESAVLDPIVRGGLIGAVFVE